MPYADPDKQRAYLREYAKRPELREKRLARNRVWKAANKTSERESAKRRRFEQYAFMASLKLEAGCLRCGYNKCSNALDFHHRNPQQKLFGIGHLGGVVGREKLLIEIAKCDVLCRNCHAELHSLS